MDYFGDVSGDFRGLLNRDCEVCVVAVVGGDRVMAGSCPKKTVRRVNDIKEARWNDLLPKQKRRLFECLAEKDSLQFGYATFTRHNLHKMEHYHHIYEDSLTPAWDLCLTGYAYGEILFELDAPDDRRPPIFEFDRVASTKQCEVVRDHIRQFVPNTKVYFEGSDRRQGIQAADCLAGGIAEDIKKDTDWMGYLDDECLVNCKSNSIVQLEQLLYEHETGP